MTTETKVKRVRRKKTRSITIIGRNWWRKGAGGNYTTATILVNGEHVAYVGPQGGSGEYYRQLAQQWLTANGYTPGLEEHANGSCEPLWRYCERMKIALNQSASDVARERDL